VYQYITDKLFRRMISEKYPLDHGRHSLLTGYLWRLRIRFGQAVLNTLRYTAGYICRLLQFARQKELLLSVGELVMESEELYDQESERMKHFVYSSSGNSNKAVLSQSKRKDLGHVRFG
jgi:hypothetical protein